MATEAATEQRPVAEAESTPKQPATTPAAAAEVPDHAFEDSSAFECNICLELAKEPVVTLCGHLYCWPCLYRYGAGLSNEAFPFSTLARLWPAVALAGSGPTTVNHMGLHCALLFPRRGVRRWMQVQTYSRACPVCKAGVDVDKVVPIYGRGSDPAAKEQDPVKPVPPRPAGQRPAAVQVRSLG